MSSSAAGPPLAHRTISNIRSGAGQPTSPTAQPGPSTPQTPGRVIPSSAFSSPSSLRAEEDTIIIEPGSRWVRVGFAGDPSPKAVLSSGANQQRRAGDYTAWTNPDAGSRSQAWPSGRPWSSCHELWRSDQDASDSGLVSDKLERVLRNAFTQHLLIDSRPRRLCLVLPPTLPSPLLSTILDTLFTQFQAPTISLMSSAVMTAVGAGLRSAIVVDIGWAETVVTSVYEYREIRQSKSVRGGRMLAQATHDMLLCHLDLPGRSDRQTYASAEQPAGHALSFEECEDVMCRLTWARQAAAKQTAGPAPRGLSTVVEHDEVTGRQSEATAHASHFQIPLTSCAGPPRLVEVPVSQLADPCEETFMASDYSRASFDDQEVPIPELIYNHLLALPIDARARCMARLVFTGGCARIPGLKRRIFDEVSHTVQMRGWDPVFGRGADMVRAKASKKPSTQAVANTTEAEPILASEMKAHDLDGIEKSLQSSALRADDVQGTLRVVESLGPWIGASLAVQTKNVAVASVERELWMQQGLQGASKANEVDMKAQQRQSLGPGVLRGTLSGNWTLGAWGSS